MRRRNKHTEKSEAIANSKTCTNCIPDQLRRVNNGFYNIFTNAVSIFFWDGVRWNLSRCSFPVRPILGYHIFQVDNPCQTKVTKQLIAKVSNERSSCQDKPISEKLTVTINALTISNKNCNAQNIQVINLPCCISSPIVIFSTVNNVYPHENTKHFSSVTYKKLM